MGIGHSIVSELNFDSLQISHPSPSTIVQPVTGGDVLWYVFYRFLMAVYMVVTFSYGLFSDLEGDWLVALHFPVWGYTIATCQSVLLAYCTFENYYSVYKSMPEVGAKHKDRRRRSTSSGRRRKRKMTFTVSLPTMPKKYIVIWVAHYIMLYTALMTLVMYTTKLFKGRLPNVIPRSHYRTTDEILLHEVFFVYSLIDFCISGIPVRLLHGYVMTVYATIYQLTLLIVTLASNHQHNYRPLYDVADFQARRVTICSIYFVGFSFITPIAVHIIYYGLFLLKSYTTEFYFQTTHVMAKPKLPVIDMTVTPDESGTEVAQERVPGTARSSKIMPISEQEETEISSFHHEQIPSNNSIALVDFK